MRKFTADRGWERFHDPKSLLLALVGEVGELTRSRTRPAPDDASKSKLTGERRMLRGRYRVASGAEAAR